MGVAGLQKRSCRAAADVGFFCAVGGDAFGALGDAFGALAATGGRVGRPKLNRMGSQMGDDKASGAPELRAAILP